MTIFFLIHNEGEEDTFINYHSTERLKSSLSPSSHHHSFITSLRKELGKDLLEGIFVDQTTRAFLLEAPVDQLDLLPGKPCGGCKSGEFLRLVSAAKGERCAPGAP